MTGDQVIGLSPKDKPTGQAGNQEKKETENPNIPISQYPDIPISRYPDTPIPRFPDSKKAGFSLLEVMVAVVIMAFGLLAIMHLFPIGLRASRISQDTTVATFLAQQKTEELRNSRYDYIDDIPLTGTFAAPFDDFSWTKSVTKCEEVYTLSEVIVEVSYTPYGQGRRVKLVTFVTNYKHH